MPKDSTRELALKPVVEKAVEVYAGKPDIHHQDAAKMLGISENTLYRLRRDPNFWAKVYDYYMVTFEGDVVAVLMAMIREAKAGNVQAGRIVLEHSGKLIKNIVRDKYDEITINIHAPDANRVVPTNIIRRSIRSDKKPMGHCNTAPKIVIINIKIDI